MKPLRQLTDQDKAQLMAELFPELLPHLVDHQLKYAENTIADSNQIIADWDNPLMPAQFWINLAQTTVNEIKLRHVLLKKSPGNYATYLYERFLAVFNNKSMQEFAEKSKHSTKEFKVAVILFYNFNPFMGKRID